MKQNYADVILPLPLEGTFTYAIPASLDAKVKVGMRVLVPLGRSKTYTAVVTRIHDQRPQIMQKDGSMAEVKDVADVLDDRPMLLDSQLKLWHWIADYYMCPLGEVYKAALPSGLKQEDGYRPKTETYVRLTPTYRTEAALHAALNMLMRAPRQQEVFTTFLALSNYDSIEGDTLPDEPREVTREELTNVSKCQSTHIKQLIDRGFLETYDVEVGRLNTTGEPHPERIKPLTEAQQRAYDQLLPMLNLHGGDAQTAPTAAPPSPTADSKTKTSTAPPPVLLHGVTGSGKTEVYIHLIQKAIDEGRQVLYLVPEIALTVQIMKRLHRVFGDRLGIYHSRYSDAERVEIWQKQLSDKPYDVILGARSAVLLPFTRLGLVIIDEEHEQSFKQQDPAPRYHARSVAIMMAHRANASVLLGTATPSAETYHNAVTGKYKLVQLTERYQGMQLPEIKVVDMREAMRRKRTNGPFSLELLSAIRQALGEGRQVILFQNRRGWAPQVECHDCGWTPKCENCDVTLTMHRTTNQLTCHYCGYTYSTPQQCPSCFCKDIRMKGYGTEKIEDLLQSIIPEARISRMDLDTTRTKNAYDRIISDFSNGASDILIGTQMVTKGLDFARVSVVGILSADTMLNYPDFRAYEHAYQMLAQVSGRAGRQGKQGLVILQTRQPDVPVIQQVVRNDFGGFYKSLEQERQLFSYPPATRLIYVYLRHQKDSVVETAAIEMGSRLRQIFGTRVLGPDKPAVARIKQLCIRKIMLKLEVGIDLAKVRQYLRLVRQQVLDSSHNATLQIVFDVDPA